MAAEADQVAVEVDPKVDDARARLLSSFVPALMLNAMDEAKANIEPPTTHEYSAVALFAVHIMPKLTLGHARKHPCIDWGAPRWRRIFRGSRLSTNTLRSREATALAR